MNLQEEGDPSIIVWSIKRFRIEEHDCELIKINWISTVGVMQIERNLRPNLVHRQPKANNRNFPRCLWDEELGTILGFGFFRGCAIEKDIRVFKKTKLKRGEINIGGRPNQPSKRREWDGFARRRILTFTDVWMIRQLLSWRTSTSHASPHFCLYL